MRNSYTVAKCYNLHWHWEQNAAAYAAESHVPEGLVGTIIPRILATIFVLARFYSRGVLTRNLGADDAWIALPWVSRHIAHHALLAPLLTRHLDSQNSIYRLELHVCQIWVWPSYDSAGCSIPTPLQLLDFPTRLESSLN